MIIELFVMSCGILITVLGIKSLIKKSREQQKFMLNLEVQLDFLNKELQLLRKADLTVANLISHIESKLEVIETKQHKLSQQSTVHSTYDQALKLLDMGMRIEDVLSTCRLSKAEAELLQNLHAYKYIAVD